MDVENLFRRVCLNYNLPTVLKKNQIEILNHLLNYQRDVFAILPTGYGKSLPYVAMPLILDEVYVPTGYGKSLPYVAMPLILDEVYDTECFLAIVLLG